jgi:hypothetical protein
LCGLNVIGVLSNISRLLLADDGQVQRCSGTAWVCEWLFAAVVDETLV